MVSNHGVNHEGGDHRQRDLKYSYHLRKTLTVALLAVTGTAGSAWLLFSTSTESLLMSDFSTAISGSRSLRAGGPYFLEEAQSQYYDEWQLRRENYESPEHDLLQHLQKQRQRQQLELDQLPEERIKKSSRQIEEFEQDNATGSQQHRRLLDSLAGYSDPKSVTSKLATHEADIPPNSLNSQTEVHLPRALNSSPASESGNPIHHHYQAQAKGPLPPYSVENVLLTLPAFYRELFVLYYDAADDTFLVLIDEHKDKFVLPVRNRLNVIMPMLAYALRNHFPERFQGAEKGSQDFVVLASSGDEPKLSCDCVNPELRVKFPDLCQNEQFAPILQFGSMYIDDGILPNAVTMPVWHHMPCFREWQQSNTVCSSLREQVEAYADRNDDAELGNSNRDDNAEGTTPAWDKLIPQIIWRGTDFGFLHCIYRKVRGADFDVDVTPRLSRLGNDAKGVIAAMMEVWHNLTPRWRGVLLTAEAEHAAAEKKQQLQTKMQRKASELGDNGHELLPWIDVKFTLKTSVFGKPAKHQGSRYKPFIDYGIEPIGERMNLSQLANYKYQIDFGGGGGTTWSGTIEKLAMPGVLFHHVTPTKDYFHDDLIPWGHYIPVDAELNNLREMYEWAEAHPEDVKKIAKAGSEFAKNMGTPEVMEIMYRRYFVDSLRSVVEAYTPQEGVVVKEQLLQGGKGKLSLVAKCSGRDAICKFLKGILIN